MQTPISDELRATLDALKEADEAAEALTYAAHAARVKRDLLVRRARRQGGSLRVIAAVCYMNPDSVRRRCLMPEPKLRERRRPQRAPRGQTTYPEKASA
jgi:hypothetical protein